MPRLNRAESRLATRTRLLASARAIFLRDGYARASLEAIAEEAGFSKGAVYSNFEGKEALFIELLTAKLERDLADLKNVGQGRDASDVLARLRTYLTGKGEILDFTRVTVEFLAQLSPGSVYAKQCAKLYREQRAAFAEQLKELFTREGAAPPVTAADLSAAFLAVTLGLAVQRGIDRPAISTAMWARTVEAMLGAMMAVPETGGPDQLLR